MDMSRLVTIVACFIMATALSFFTTPAARFFAFKIGAVDIPKDERRMHTEPTARVGGLAIYFGFIASVFFFGLFSYYLNLSSQMLGIIIGGVIILVLGFLDDVFTLSAWPKLIVQIVSASIPIAFGVRIDLVSILAPFAPNYPTLLNIISVVFTFIWIIGVINAVNLIDGLDALASGVTTIASVAILVIMMLIGNIEMALVSAALAGSCLGFVPFNKHPASIFMGDTGSTFLGFMLATISVQGLFKPYLAVSFAVPFLLLGIPIFDTLYAIIRRISQGRSPMSADRLHIHHRLVDMGFSQRQAAKIIFGATAGLSLCAIAITFLYFTVAIVICVIILMFMLVLLFLLMNSKIAIRKTKR